MTDATATCSDCGSRPVWQWSSHGYCRSCNEKNGHLDESRVEIDPDKLEAEIGGDLADVVLRFCRPD